MYKCKVQILLHYKKKSETKNSERFSIQICRNFDVLSKRVKFNKNKNKNFF